MSTLIKRSIVDIAIGWISIGLGLGVYYLTFGFQIAASSGLASGMSATLYPRLIGGILISLGLAMLFKTYFLGRLFQPIRTDKEAGDSGKFGIGLIKLFPLAIGFTAAFPVFGYLISTTILVTALLLVSGERRFGLMAVTTALIVLSFYLLFRYGFNIVLPEGNIWQLRS